MNAVRLLLLLLAALFLGSCRTSVADPPADPEPHVLSYTELLAGRAYIPSAYQSLPGVTLDDLGAVRYRMGDDTSWAAAGYDDSAWDIMPGFEQLSYACGRVYWFRVHYAVDQSFRDKPLHFQMFSPGALEVYVDGRKLQQAYGEFVQTAGGTAVDFPEVMPRRVQRFSFSPRGEGVLAFRYSVCPMVEAPGGRGLARLAALHVNIHPVGISDRMRLKEDVTLVYYGIFAGAVCLIFLLTLILYVYDRKEKSWEYIGISAFCNFLVALANLTPKGMLGASFPAIQLSYVANHVFYPLSVFCLLLVTQCMFGRIRRRTTLPFFALIVAAIAYRLAGFFLIEEQEWISLALISIVFLEIGRLSIKALRRRLPGRWILGTGVFIFFLLGVVVDYYYQIAGLEMPWTLRTVTRFSYYLAMPTAMTIFLALKSAENGRLAARRRDELDAEVRRRTSELQKEKEKSEQLLLNILPSQVAEELKEKGFSEAREFDLATVLFADFIDFTEKAGHLPAKELLAELNHCFRAFDAITARYHVEKIKTIGDAYMAAGGLESPALSAPADVVLAALEMQQFVRERREERQNLGLPYFEMRVGIHTGPVVAGIVGVIKFQYDIWGDTVNIASRMENAGSVGQVNISQATYERLAGDPRFVFRERGFSTVKGKGEMMMFFAESTEPVGNWRNV